MKLRILKSLFVIGLILGSLTVTGSQALFTDTATSENNTFASGNVDVKLYYYCPEEIDTYPVNGVADRGAIVECPYLAPNNGTLEADGLKYEVVTDGAIYNYLAAGDIYNVEAPFGSRWTTANYWWDGLSSAMDHTNIYPGWSNHSVTNNDPDLVSVGNAGTLPVNLTANVNYEAANINEALEPLDGVIPGGDRVDPLSDDPAANPGWQQTLGKVYSNTLGDVINVSVDRVNNTGAVVANAYTGTLTGLTGAGTVALGTLESNEVAYVTFNYDVPSTVDETYQNLVFDYSVLFNVANTTP